MACWDIGLGWFVSRTIIRRLGNHMRINAISKLDRFLTLELVSRLSRLMRVNYGWRCMCDEFCVDVKNLSKTRDSIKLSNRYSVLQHEDSIEHGRALDRLDTSPNCEVGQSSMSACTKN